MPDQRFEAVTDIDARMTPFGWDTAFSGEMSDSNTSAGLLAQRLRNLASEAQWSSIPSEVYGK